jgi:predicted amidohydrolase
VFEQFWQAGLKLIAGAPLRVEPLNAYTSPAINVTIAGAQMACSRRIAENVARMQEMVREAASKRADLVVFPELAATGALEEDIRRATAEELATVVNRMRRAAKENGIYVVFGTPYRAGEQIMNSAFAIGADGVVLTRYDQMVVDRPALFRRGANPRSMWFRVKGIPAVVTIGKDGLWNEIAELAAHAGAQIHVHMNYNRARGEAAELRRMQVWANLASFKTFSPTVNAASPARVKIPSAPADGGSAIWDDLNGHREIRIALDTMQPNPDSTVRIFSPWSANCIVKADTGDAIIYATRRVNAKNPYRQPALNPQMTPWYDFGGHLISPGPLF